MWSLRHWLTGVVISGAALSGLPMMSGCTGEATYVVEDAPPPPREEVVTYRPGFVWVHGRWTHPGHRWVWEGGRYERERPNQVYVEGRWERRARGHVWVDGSWRDRGGVVVRDHR